MAPVQTYKAFLTELVRRHMVILGPNISLDTANHIAGFTVDSSGEVQELSGAPLLVLQDLFTAYQQLSAPVTVISMHMLLEKYPDIKQEYNQPLPQVKLVCALAEVKP